MRLNHAGATDVGRKRRVNEDAYGQRSAAGLFVVADGLGGHVAGRRASSTSTESFLQRASCGDARQPAEAMRYAMHCANMALLEAAEREPELRGMATTMVALWIRGREATFAHAGDSRLYVLRDGKLLLLTVDHSLVGELVARGELSPDVAQDHPQRHVITRALGVAAHIEPDISTLRVQESDLFLLCSDGISSQVTEDDIRDILVANTGDLAAAARELIAAANDRGGEDNATALLVSAHGP